MYSPQRLLREDPRQEPAVVQATYHTQIEELN